MTDSRELEQRIKDLEAEVGALRRNVPRGIRKRASFELFGLPAYDIALGPDPATGALRGHAKGFLAIGDLATGVIAIGGLARGLVALGGVPSVAQRRASTLWVALRLAPTLLAPNEKTLRPRPSLGSGECRYRGQNREGRSSEPVSK